ncbi:peptidoglycan DD-metalloendopeptidase family protein [Bacteroides sp. OttesenSCG-928-E20]|nr:peptidoglycan DD-metalloendopeptidase family protein [Bacteroides sp. OttesenSCG-928-E20]MDL2305047.1 peptidoglycan DD-metalloendopeptidase family protein [Bacteroides sp. OttesenSCG-928-D19]
MNFNCIKTGLIAAVALLSLNSFSQDLIAHQAPVDKKLKSVDSLALHKQIIAEQAAYPAFDLYPTWSNASVRNYSGVKLPESHKIDLTGFCMPTTNTRITSKFGPRRRRMHSGIDVKVQVGDTIYAAFDGKVRIVKNQGRRTGYGLYVVIRHGNGLETVYGHLSKQMVSEEQYVKAGEPIGLGGNTGRSTGSHLHFETLFLGIAINPALLFDFERQDIVSDHYTFRSPKGSRAGTSSHLAVNGDGVIRYHKVRSGDTLSKISAQKGISIDALCKLNHITRKTILRPGQVLRCS